MRPILQLSLLIAVVMMSPLPAAAQFRYFTTENGLQSNTVKSLFQSSDGHIWAGTPKGLCRHNGIEFSEYGIEDNHPFRTEVLAICESPQDHTLWIGCVDGLYSLDRKTMRVAKVHPYKGETDYFQSGVNCLCMDNKRNLWIGSNGKGLYKYHVDTGECTFYPHCSQGKIIQRVMMTTDNILYFCAQDEDCIYRYSGGRDEFIKIPISDRFTKEKAYKIADICQDSYGDLWICDNHCTLFRLHPYDIQSVSYKLTLPKRINDVRVMIEHTTENLVIGTSMGLVRFDCNALEFSWLDEGDIRNGRTLNDRFVYSLLRDTDTGLWVGTYFGGVNYKSPIFDLIGNVQIPDNCGNIISVMCETEKNHVLIGSDDGGLNRYDFSTKAFERIIIDNDNPNLNIHCIYPDGDNIWIGTYGNGLYRLDRNLQVKKHYQSTDISIGDFHVYSALRDRYGNLWMGTPQGICKYDPHTDCFMRTLLFDNGNDVTDIIEWEGSIYFASQGKGLIRYDRETDEFEFLTFGDELNKRISTLEVFRSALYLGSYEGLYVYDGKTIQKKGGEKLGQSNIASFTSDNNYLWITTSNGLFCYWNEDRIRRFGREYGLPSESFNTNSSIKLSNGEVLVGTERGLSVFKSAQLTTGDEDHRINAVIADFNVFMKNGGLQERQSNREQMVIKSKDASFSIRISALNYLTPKSSSFQYKLLGRDKEWNYLQSGQGYSDVIYTSVKPGRYTFKVCASMSDSGLFGPEESLDIVIRRPVSHWIEIWATTAGLLLLIYSLLLVFIRDRRIKHYLKRVRNVQIEKNVAQRIFNAFLEESRDALSRLKLTFDSISDTSHLDEEDANVMTMDKNLKHLFNLVSQASGKVSELDRKGDVVPVLESILETYTQIARNAYGTSLRYSISDQARSMKMICHLKPLSAKVQDLLDSCLEKSVGNIEIKVDAEGEALELLVIPHGGSLGKNRCGSLQIAQEAEAPAPTLDEPTLNRHFKKDVFNVIVYDNESCFKTEEIRSGDTVFNVVRCHSLKEVEIGFSNFSIIAFVCGQTEEGHVTRSVLKELKNQYSKTLFITLSSSPDDAERIADLSAFADLTLTRPVSMQLMASHIRSLLKLRNAKGSVVIDESSVLSKIDVSDNFTKCICEIIKEKKAEPDLSVQDLAKAMNVSRATVFNRLKTSLDTTPNNLIRDIRLETAAKMLTQGNVRVSEVYYKVGFTSGSYFSKLFHDRYGISPKDYRR